MKTTIGLKQSAPNSAKSRSSESSGYMSRGGEKSKRPGGREAATLTARTAPTPLRKLAHTNSTSSLKVQSNRSSSSLTSKEAEFQAWKRRKNYDPLKSASRYLLFYLRKNQPLFYLPCLIFLLLGTPQLHLVETLQPILNPRVPTLLAQQK